MSSVPVEGVEIAVCSLDHLIAMKEASGRPKDLLVASEYRVISDELRAPRGGSRERRLQLVEPRAVGDEGVLVGSRR